MLWLTGALWGWFDATAAQKYPGSHRFGGLDPEPKGAKPEKAGISKRSVCKHQESVVVQYSEKWKCLLETLTKGFNKNL